MTLKMQCLTWRNFLGRRSSGRKIRKRQENKKSFIIIKEVLSLLNNSLHLLFAISWIYNPNTLANKSPVFIQPNSSQIVDFHPSSTFFWMNYEGNGVLTQLLGIEQDLLGKLIKLRGKLANPALASDAAASLREELVTLETGHSQITNRIEIQLNYLSKPKARAWRIPSELPMLAYYILTPLSVNYVGVGEEKSAETMRPMFN